MERATGRSQFKKYNHIIICEVHTHTSSTSSARFLYSRTTITKTAHNTHTCACIWALSLTLSHARLCTHRLTFVYIHLWLDCGPFRNFSMDFYGRLYAYLSLSLRVISVWVSFRDLAVGEYMLMLM